MGDAVNAIGGEVKEGKVAHFRGGGFGILPTTFFDESSCAVWSIGAIRNLQTDLLGAPIYEGTAPRLVGLLILGLVISRAFNVADLCLGDVDEIISLFGTHYFFNASLTISVRKSTLCSNVETLSLSDDPPFGLSSLR